jgi:hypothetical protein
MAYAFDPKDDVETQWQKWQEANPPSTYLNIDKGELRETVIKDLTYVSQMDVKEYTLYQKWCEIQQKYPTQRNMTVFGEEEVFLVDPSQQKIVDEVKSNIWVPENPDSYLDLEPVLEYTDDSGETTRIAVDGTEVKVDRKRNKELPEKWNTIRNFISTMKNNSNIGRNLNFIVKDNKTGKYLGVICISSDFLDLTPRD